MLGLALRVLLAVAAGVSVVVQQVLNSNLRMALDSAAWSGFKRSRNYHRVALSRMRWRESAQGNYRACEGDGDSHHAYGHRSCRNCT